MVCCCQNKYKLIVMFRQPSQVKCGCSLFVDFQLLQNQSTRNPQKSIPDKSNQQKKSLKHHSSSRRKNQLIGCSQNKNQQNKLYLPTSSKTFLLKNDHSFNQSSIGIVKKYGKAKHFYQNNLNQNESFCRTQNHNSLNGTSNQQIFQMIPRYSNAGRRVKFNYSNQSQVSLEAKTYQLAKVTSESQLSTNLTFSTFPNTSQLHKTRAQQKYRSNCPNEVSQENKCFKLNVSEVTLCLQSRPQSSNLLMLQRLSEMMNQKEEAQSIYQDQEDPKNTSIEYSRVIFSCKKLMEENKNGFLRESEQSKLFNFSEAGKNSIVGKSEMFDKIQINVQ